MLPIGKSPSCLIRNRHSYCFRMNVPVDLQAFIGKKELRYSLKTGYIGVAKHKSRYLAAQIRFLFNSFREGCSVFKRLTDDQIRKIVNQYIQDRIKFINGPGYIEDYQNSIPYPKCRPFLFFSSNHLLNADFLDKPSICIKFAELNVPK